MKTFMKTLLKGFLCGLIYLAVTLLIVILGCMPRYDMRLAFVLGAVYGIAAALIVVREKISMTLLTSVTGFVFVVFAYFINWLYRERIALYMYRDDQYVREMGKLSLNHRIGYNWSLMFFDPIAFAVFVIAIVAITVARYIKRKKQEKQEESEPS